MTISHRVGTADIPHGNSSGSWRCQSLIESVQHYKKVSGKQIDNMCQSLIESVQQLCFQRFSISLYSFFAFFQANYWETPSVRSERVLTDGKFPVREDSLEKRRLKDGAELRNLPRRGGVSPSTMKSAKSRKY